MPREIETFITQMKLQELRKQRTALLQAYDRLSQPPTTEGLTPFEHLFHGLRELQFADKPLHPDIANLYILRQTVIRHPAAAELITFWTQQLEKEVRLGRNRAEAVYRFAILLEEWSAQNSTTQDAAARDEVQQQLVAQLTQVGQTGDFATFLAPLLQPYQDGLRKIQPPALRYHVTPKELGAHLQRIRGDIYRPAGLRQQAREFLSDEAWQKELADALTLMIENLDQWAWSERGVAIEAIWTRTKWRLMLKEDLATACLLEILGARWARHLKAIFDQRNPKLPVPVLVHPQETRTPKNKTAKDDQSLFNHGSVWHWRQHKREELRANIFTNEYGGGYGATTLDKALLMIHAEIRTWQAAYPQQPLYVTKADLRDYYPSLPHTLLHHLLTELRLPAAESAFFARYMAIPLRQGDQITPVQRGVVSHRILSDVLGEIVLRLLDDYVQQVSNALVIRVVDDICLITTSAEQALQAWQAVADFCAVCGLAINTAKSGAVCIGGELPAGLPAQHPLWQLLALDERGEWSVHQPKLEEHLAVTRQHLQATPSVIGQVEVYNANLNYLLRGVAMGTPLGDVHRQSVAQTVARFHYALFGENQGIAAHIQAQWQARIASTEANPLTEALLYYPITAGGLGLQQGMIVEACFAVAYAQHPPLQAPDKRPADWQSHSAEWGRLYRKYFLEMRPAPPANTPVMETLVKDFIERGSTLTSGKQQDLSYYWRWILYLYGGQILEAFGTFRFLIEELVPMQLIVQQRMGATSLFDAGNSNAVREVDDIPF